MTLTQALTQFRAATAPEDVFDGVSTLADLKAQFRDLAKIVHPDGKAGTALKQAEEAFKLLEARRNEAEDKIKRGTYGDRSVIAPVILRTKKQLYTLTRKLPPGDVANTYAGMHEHVADPKQTFAFKVCRSPANNDLLDNEREILNYLWNEAKTKQLEAMSHMVKYTDSFEMMVGPVRKRVNVCELAEGYFNLVEVAAAYPEGLDIRDSAWILNRMLGGILIAQQAGVVHNAVLPEHVLMHPDKHNVKLCGWSYATKGHEKVKAIVVRRMSLYPAEVIDKKATSTATDLYMAVKTILTITRKSTVPRNIMGLFNTCLLARNSRPQDAWEFFKEFGAELVNSFGPKKFRKFTMPGIGART